MDGLDDLDFRAHFEEFWIYLVFFLKIKVIKIV